MLDTFLHSSATTFLAMLKIFLVMLTVGLQVRSRILTPGNIKGLSAAITIILQENRDTAAMNRNSAACFY